MSSSIIVNGGPLCSNQLFGVHRNTYELLSEIDGIIKPGDISIAVPAGWEDRFPFRNIKVLEIKVPNFKSMHLIRHFWTDLIFPHLIKERGCLGVDLALGLPVQGADVVAIYDCIRELYPQNAPSAFSRIARLRYIKRVRKLLKQSKLVLTDSKSAKQEIVDYYRISSDKVIVIYCGWQHMIAVKQDDAILQKLGLSEKDFYFSLGSQYYHKNSRWIIEAAKTNGGERFVISGLNDSRDTKMTGFVPANVTFTGYLTDSEIKSLMAHCKAFIQPSLSEGFGIPPLEAMSVGARCIVSDIPVFHEVYGDSVWYVDPLKYENIDVNAIMNTPLTGDSSEILARYSWSESARVLLDALREL